MTRSQIAVALACVTAATMATFAATCHLPSGGASGAIVPLAAAAASVGTGIGGDRVETPAPGQPARLERGALLLILLAARGERRRGHGG